MTDDTDERVVLLMRFGSLVFFRKNEEGLWRLPRMRKARRSRRNAARNALKWEYRLHVPTERFDTAGIVQADDGSEALVTLALDIDEVRRLTAKRWAGRETRFLALSQFEEGMTLCANDMALVQKHLR